MWTHGAGTHRQGSPHESTITGHGLHFDSGGSEELADLGGMLKDVQRHTSNNHAVQHAVVSMGGREWPSRRVLGQQIKRSAHPFAAVVDVTEQFSLGEHTVRKGVGVVVKGLWRFPRLELGGEVVVEGRQRVVGQEPGGLAMQAPVRGRTRGCLVRPQVRFPQVVGTVHEGRLHEAQSLIEVAGHTLHKRVRHTVRNSAHGRIWGAAAHP